MAEFSKKLVAVLNEKVEIGKAMNTLGHMTLGLGANIENKEELEYYGIILFGEWELVSELTKKFSLWK